MKKTIGIIGLGYVGLTLGIAAADCGVVTYGVEINPHIKECLAAPSSSKSTTTRTSSVWTVFRRM